MNPMQPGSMADETFLTGDKKEEKGGKSPRLMALEKLLDFIAQSETKRAMPPEPPPESPAGDELDSGALAGLAGLKDDDKDGM